MTDKPPWRSHWGRNDRQAALVVIRERRPLFLPFAGSSRVSVSTPPAQTRCCPGGHRAGGRVRDGHSAILRGPVPLHHVCAPSQTRYFRRQAAPRPRDRRLASRKHPSPEPGLARKHDETYKLIFSQRAAVEELVCNFVGEDLGDELDFDTLEALPTDRISGGLVQRQVDLLWKIRFRDSWLYLLILLEFQSESDYFMALRILTYICLTYEELLRRKEVKAGDKLPPVLPVTVYNGRARWQAATDISELIAPVPPPLAQYLPQARHLLLDLQRIGDEDPPSKDLVTSLGKMEREPSPENIQRVMRSLAVRFPEPGFTELRKALVAWLAGAGEAWQIPKEELARLQTSMEEETMYERVKEMRDQVHRDGVQKGLERGRAEGRALVGRLATRKFGAETAEQLSRVLGDIAEPERLAEVADAIIDCNSDTELFARVGA
ncbi:MAG: hypothetical protein F4123_03790 [Gemmatimonadetes bacterium]|nr:hypothetical protein [Gemmatimonadota bacterium]MYC00135.1 hypothetical protein [Gemmatimonadota bacterium]MYI45506.1 hypothetical protein [Gemmatimonadota bacterium]